MNFHMAYFSWIPQNNARLKLSCKFGESKWNPHWVIVLMSSSDSNYVANNHEDVDKYGSVAIPSGIMPDKRTDAGDDNNPSAEEAEG